MILNPQEVEELTQRIDDVLEESQSAKELVEEFQRFLRDIDNDDEDFPEPEEDD